MTDGDAHLTRPRAATPVEVESSTVAVIRGLLLAILLLGLLGTVVELLLLRHVGGVWETLPLLLLAAAVLVLAWYGVSRSAAPLRALQGMMLLFLVSGALGTWLHFQANITYERESNPSLAGRELLQHTVMGATPMLAPGTMIQLGLVGLAFAFRHPRLGPSSRANTLL